MTCSELAEGQLFAYLDGGLDAANERSGVEGHLKHCPTCQQEKAMLTKLMTGFRALSESTSLDPPTWERIGEQVSKRNPLALRLAEAMADHDIKAATALINQYLEVVSHFRAAGKDAPLFLSMLMQWIRIRGIAHSGIERGYSQLAFVESEIRQFPATLRQTLPLIDCAHLRLVEGLLALYVERYDLAIPHFRFILSAEQDLPEQPVVATATASLAHAHQRLGEYDEARRLVEDAISRANRIGRHRMAAYFSVTRAWLLSQRRECTEQAISVYHQAAETLRGTSDHRSLGNIEAGLARIARRAGNYKEALRGGLASLDEFRQCDALHLNLARSLVHIAFTKRLLALSSSKRSTLDKSDPTRTDAESLRDEAFAHLEEACAIYERNERNYDGRGLGSVALTRSLIHLDLGDLMRSECEMRNALRLGQDNNDAILVVRSRILECMIENEHHKRCSQSEASLHASRAFEAIKEAIAGARNIQGDRFLAKSLIWHGLTLLIVCPAAVIEARRCYEQAAQLLDSHTNDYVRENLRELEHRLQFAEAPEKAVTH